jgi:rhodanese-related sulfurtransferase
MNNKIKWRELIREIFAIIVLCLLLAFFYNVFSSRGIPIIRHPRQNVAVSDSALFSERVIKGDTSTSPIFKNVDTLDKNNLSVSSTQRTMKIPIAKKGKAYKTVTLVQVKRLLSERKGILFDARNPEEFQKGHIKGAKNIPALGTEQYIEQIITIPSDTLIVIYCNNRDCHLGNMLADFLSVMKFNNLYLYEEGWDGWVNAKMPIDSSINIDGGNR